MINVKELRLGNLILHELFDTVEVIAIYKNSYDVSRDGKTKEWFAGIGCKGIPLTEEWLVKLGFQEIGETREYFISFQGRLHFVVMHNKEPRYSMGYDSDGVIQIPTNYVHQLQNIYFALTGEELTINLLT